MKNIIYIMSLITIFIFSGCVHKNTYVLEDDFTIENNKFVGLTDFLKNTNMIKIEPKINHSITGTNLLITVKKNFDIEHPDIIDTEDIEFIIDKINPNNSVKYFPQNYFGTFERKTKTWNKATENTKNSFNKVQSFEERANNTMKRGFGLGYMQGNFFDKSMLLDYQGNPEILYEFKNLCDLNNLKFEKKDKDSFFCGVLKMKIYKKSTQNQKIKRFETASTYVDAIDALNPNAWDAQERRNSRSYLMEIKNDYVFHSFWIDDK